MTSREPQGWYDDPFRLHEGRYFSAGQPTKLVRDGDVESYDEPPTETVTRSGTSKAWGDAVSRTPDRAEAAGPDRLGGVPPHAARRPWAGVLTAVGVVAIAGAVTAAVLIGNPRPATLPVTEAMAYTATMNASSADVRAIYAYTAGNRKFDTTATESGPVSWSASQGDTVMSLTIGGQPSVTTRQIIDGGKTYSKISVKGLPASVLTGLPGLGGWSEVTWTGTSSQDLSGILSSLLLGGLFNPVGMASPTSLLELLRAQASSVQNLGGEVLDGVSTTHYRAIIPFSRLGGTAAEVQQAEQELGTSFFAVDYWIDSSDLLRQLHFAVSVPRPPSAPARSPGQVTIPPGFFPITFSVILQLSHYGTPVHVVAPPSAQITSHGTCVVSEDGFNCTTG